MTTRTPARETTPEQITATAEAQAAQDQVLMDALLQKNGALQNPQPAPRRAPTLSENFVDVANLIAETRKNLRLSEQTLIKAWELTLMWALNNRASTTPDIYPTETEDEGVGDEGGSDLPIPTEVITGDQPETTTEE